MILADQFSRILSRKENSPIELYQNIQHMSFPPNRINIICGPVERDPLLSTVHHLTLNGWPEKSQ